MQIIWHGDRIHKNMQKSKLFISHQKPNFKNSINNRCRDLQFLEKISSQQRRNQLISDVEKIILYAVSLHLSQTRQEKHLNN